MNAASMHMANFMYDVKIKKEGKLCKDLKSRISNYVGREHPQHKLVQANSLKTDRI